MPIPAAAGFVAAVVHYYKQPITTWQLSYVWLVVVGILGFLMISRMRYYSFKTLDLHKRRSYLGIILVRVDHFVYLVVFRTHSARPGGHLRAFRHHPEDYGEDPAPSAFA